MTVPGVARIRGPFVRTAIRAGRGGSRARLEGEDVESRFEYGKQLLAAGVEVRAGFEAGWYDGGRRVSVLGERGPWWGGAATIRSRHRS